jgi:hypothetical protein
MNAFAEMSLRRDRLEDALSRVVFMARTSGGTAGRDEALCAACDNAENVLAEAGSGRPLILRPCE